MSDLNSKHNRIVWCDIFVDDLDRACAFYEGVCNITCQRETFGDIQFAVLEHTEGNGGCLVPRQPGQSDSRWGGVLVYHNVDGRIRDAVEKVEAGCARDRAARVPGTDRGFGRKPDGAAQYE